MYSMYQKQWIDNDGEMFLKKLSLPGKKKKVQENISYSYRIDSLDIAGVLVTKSHSVLLIAHFLNGSHNLGLIFDPVIEVFHIVTLLICSTDTTAMPGSARWPAAATTIKACTTIFCIWRKIPCSQVSSGLFPSR